MLYLYGPPASGKTTLARALALEWGRMYVDLDEEIVRRAGRTIPEIFAESGEAGFRRIESEMLRSVDAPIVSLGGGTLLDRTERLALNSPEPGFAALRENLGDGLAGAPDDLLVEIDIHTAPLKGERPCQGCLSARRGAV